MKEIVIASFFLLFFMHSVQNFPDDRRMRSIINFPLLKNPRSRWDVKKWRTEVEKFMYNALQEVESKYTPPCLEIRETYANYLLDEILNSFADCDESCEYDCKPIRECYLPHYEKYRQGIDDVKNSDACE